MAINPLKSYRILIVDSDKDLGQVLRSMLGDMGFSLCEYIHSGLEAFRMLQNKPYDFLITEWRAAQLDGIDLIKKIRRAPDSPNPVLPIIMLTGRAELTDVFTARDAGINEFVVKPFTAKTIYNRIERIVENPRQFVVSENFIGPNRRIQTKPPIGVAERRVRKIQPQLQPKDVLGVMHDSNTPRVWLPDFSLKYKLGNNVRLDSLITGAVLAQAQAAIDSLSNTSLTWVRDNLHDMRLLLTAMQSGNYPENIAHDLGEVALTLNARAGTFGYGRASEISYLLYLFCRNHLKPAKKDHLTVVEKHIDVLQVILGNQMRGQAGTMGDQLVAQLKKLAEKVTS